MKDDKTRFGLALECGNLEVGSPYFSSHPRFLVQEFSDTESSDFSSSRQLFGEQGIAHRYSFNIRN